MSTTKIDTNKLTIDFINFLENLKEEDWKVKVTNEWDVKDMIIHLIGWEREATKELPKAWKTHTNPWFMRNTDNFKEFNAKNVKEFKTYTPKQLLAEWKKWQQALNDEIGKIGEDKLRIEYDFFEWVFDESEGNHYLEHFNQIKEALKKRL